MTRWHEDDLAGRLLKQQAEGTGEEWEVISYPAIAGEGDPLGRASGEALSPRYPLEELIPTKETLGPYLWNALYQQRPRPEEGNYYKVHWMTDSGDVQNLLESYAKRGQFIPIYAAMDFAISEKDQSNWNVITTGAALPGDECVLLDRVRFRGDEDADTIAEEMVAVQKKWNPLLWGCEDGQIRKSIWSTVKRKFKKEGLLLNAEFMVPIKDKLARGRTAQGQMRQGQWLFPKDAPWYEEFSEELLGFPNAEFDDQADSFAWLARLIADSDKTYNPFDLSKCLV
jgi:predicted phage terminase large subunit-like protein